MINVNEYFDGAVKSLGYETAAGKSTIGVINTGTYEFGTSQHETMTIIQGNLNVRLPAATDWQAYTQGQVFEVPANASFQVKATAPIAYLCQYR